MKRQLTAEGRRHSVHMLKNKDENGVCHAKTMTACDEEKEHYELGVKTTAKAVPGLVCVCVCV